MMSHEIIDLSSDSEFEDGEMEMEGVKNEDDFEVKISSIDEYSSPTQSTSGVETTGEILDRSHDVTNLLRKIQMKETIISGQEDEMDFLEQEKVLLEHQLQSAKECMDEQEKEIVTLKRELSVCRHQLITSQAKLTKAKEEFETIKMMNISMNQLINNELTSIEGNGIAEETIEITMEEIHPEGSLPQQTPSTVVNMTTDSAVEEGVKPPSKSEYTLRSAKKQATVSDAKHKVTRIPGTPRQSARIIGKRRSNKRNSIGMMREGNQKLKSKLSVTAPAKSKAFKKVVQPGLASTSAGQNSTVRRHIRDATKSGYVCRCGYHSSASKGLAIHMKKLNNCKKFKCSRCPRKFFNIHLYRQHLLSHTNDRCRLGGETFSNRSLLRKHQEAAHDSASSSNATPAKKTTISSTRIRNQQKSNAVVKVRSRYDYEDKPHGIDEHRLTKKIFSCICGATLRSECALRSHVRCFGGGKKFCCTHCDAKYFSVFHLKQHLKEKHDIISNKRNGCSSCGLTFRSRRALSIHINNAHNIGTIFPKRNRTRRNMSNLSNNPAMEPSPTLNSINVTDITSSDTLITKNAAAAAVRSLKINTAGYSGSGDERVASCSVGIEDTPGSNLESNDELKFEMIKQEPDENYWMSESDFEIY